MREIESFEANILSLEFEIEALAKSKAENETSLASIRSSLVELRERRAIADDRRAAVTAELAALEREHAVLAELEAAREGYGEGAKAILARRDEFPGLRGSLGELVKVERGFEQPVERALGEYLELLICNTMNDTLKIVETARNDKLGNVTCLVMELLPVAIDFTLKEDELLSRCGIDVDLRNVLAMLMGSAKQVDNLPIEPRDLDRVFVTSAGDVFRPPAFLSGGVAGSAAPGILTRRGRLAQLAELVAERSGESSALAEEIKQNASEVGRLQIEEESVAAALESAKDNLKTNQAKHQKSVEHREQSSRERENVSKRAHELDIECEGCVENARLASAGIESVKHLRVDAITDLNRLEAAIPSLGSEVEDLRTRVQRAIVEEASFKEEAERAREEIGRLKHEIGQVVDEIAKKKAGLEEVRKAAQGTSQELKDAAERRETLESRLPELESAEAEASDRIKAFESEVIESEQNLEISREEVGRLENAVHSQEIRLAELRGALTGLERDLNAFPEFAARILAGDMSGKEIPSKKELAERLEQTEFEIAEIGEVNPLAIEEELFAKGRLTELTQEREDLHRAEDELRQALEEIQRQSEKAFRSTFEDAALRFAEVFGALFPGGSGELSLTDPSDALESGIDVRVKFPDKGELDLLQFSGGERSLISLALLFAILKVKPSSFTILDEVEAALDDVNTQRFLDYLGQEFPTRQFIMITHNKITMERANRLYGVTMREAGVSQMVSVDLKKLKDEGIDGTLGSGGN